MKFSLKISKAEELPADGLAFFAWEGEMEKAGFKGKQEEILVCPGKEGLVEKIYFVGLGKKEEATPLVLRKIFALLGKRAKSEVCQTLVLSLKTLAEKKDFSLFDLGQGATEGFLLRSYKFLKYKSKPLEEIEVGEVIFAVDDASELVAVKEGISRGEIFSQAVSFTRDLVNEPASVTTPTYLANLAQKLAKTNGFSCRVYEK
ncbi:hypothetical protein HZB97_02880, partial [Candidatus Gottesmanbacteria bacterium]|nr:hypothetical protein [Candidatus Gottesmanbacteria bacterium]